LGDDMGSGRAEEGGEGTASGEHWR
jgi:hypothetical protein